MSEEIKLSPVEHFKQGSQHLRGDIPAELVDENNFFGKGSVQLLKHHGAYQQDNRDARGQGGKAYIFMVRSKIPGGRLTSEQLLAQLDLCEAIGNATLRITSRQALQLHGVLKENLHQCIRLINQSQLTTLGACGDINRNVMCCPSPANSEVQREIERLSDAIAEHLAPKTRAYHELWLTDPASGEKQLAGGGEEEVEPIYGKTYLPRKFKIGICTPEDNCIDVYTHDLGLIAIHQAGRITGYNVLVGGGQGVTPVNKNTFPALGQKLAYATPEQVLDVITAVVQVQRDFGNRANRKLARLKYLIHAWGLPAFKAKVEEYLGAPLAAPTADDVQGFNDHLGWEEQGDGLAAYGLNIENGRLQNTDALQLKTAVRQICEELKPGIRLTSHQSILFTDIAPENRDKLEAVLRRYGVTLSADISAARRWSMACVAWPTCGLAIAESERALPGMIDQLEAELERLDLSNERFTIRMTGCPNGCVRPYNSDIGLVGKAKDKYTIYLGGRLLGNRLNFVYKDMAPGGEVVAMLAPLFTYFKQQREDGESFGDFCHRKGKDDLLAFAENVATP